MTVLREHVAGSKWWSFDFHTHTPMSNDYGNGLTNQNSLKSRSPQDWLLDFMRAHVDCVAVTDHNSGEWIDVLKNALEEMKNADPPHTDLRPLYLFPGVEISVQGGVHLIGLFDIGKSTADINNLLGASGCPPITRGTSDDCTTKSFVEVARIIEEHGGIAMPAHVDDAKGLFRIADGSTLKQMLECPSIYVIEAKNSACSKPQLYIDRKLQWTEVTGSDSHNPSQVGSSFTWVKMGSPDIDGLKLALLDRNPLSIMRSCDFSGDPNTYASMIIEEISIREARYCGRGDVPFCAHFNPWLNSIIGGRGTGKSTVVEFLRIGLRREDELKGEIRKTFEDFNKTYLTRNDKGMLTDNTLISIIYRKDNARFRIQWSQKGDYEPILEEKEDGSFVPSSGEVKSRFPVRLYSQKQIYEMAKDTRALLSIIDEAPEVGFNKWQEKWKEEESRFLTLRAQEREIEVGLGDEEKVKGELDDIIRKLSLFEQSGHSEILRDYQISLKQKKEIESYHEKIKSKVTLLKQTAEYFMPDEFSRDLFNLQKENEKEIIEGVDLLEKKIKEIGEEFKGISDEIQTVIDGWFASIEKTAWNDFRSNAENQYKEVIDSLKTEGVEDPAEYGRLVQQRQVTEQKLSILGGKKKTLFELKDSEAKSINKLKSLRKELTHLRNDFIQEVLSSNPYIRMQIIPYGDRDYVESEIRELIHKEDKTFANDVLSDDGRNGLIGVLYRGYGNSMDIDEFEKKLGVLKECMITPDNCVEPFSIRDQRFRTHLNRLKPEDTDRILTWFPGDSLDVSYSPLGDGRDFRPIMQGSPGQMTAAVLAFLLSYGKEPMVLDQPEDDLDNHLISYLVVRQLRENKKRRQFIVVTHNPNIVVNGDSEMVVALTARNGQSVINHGGSMQNSTIRKEICEAMEGGEEAFKSRYRRITLGGSNV